MLRHVLGVWDRDVRGDKIISMEVTYPHQRQGTSPGTSPAAESHRLCTCH